MKKTIIYLVALLAYGKAMAQVVPNTATAPATIGSGINPVPTAYSSNATVNFIRTWTASRPYTVESDVTSGSRTVQEVKQSTQYFDGLGRPLQTVTKKASPSGKDMVGMNVYDEFGRETFKYLPYVAVDSNTGNGTFRRNPFNEQASFLGNTSYNPGLVGEQVYYGKTGFEPSPLNRPLTNYAPGNSWAGSNVGTTMAYGINTAADSVRIWDMGIGAIPTTSASYAAGKLYKNTTTDEHGKQVVEYKDLDGHTVLKKVQLAASPSAHHTGWLCTYYVYDDLGLLRYVIPPKAVEAIQGGGLWSINTDIHYGLCFQYDYDARGRMVYKKVPGAGAEFMVYDAMDRLVLKQDEGIRNFYPYNYSQYIWLAIKYDELNRPTQTSIWNDGNAYSINQLIQFAIDNGSTGYPDPGEFQYMDLLTETYYDDYSWVSGSGSGLSSSFIGTYASNTSYFYTPSNSTWPYPQTIAASDTKGMATGTKTRVLGTSDYLYATNFYDDRGRSVQSHSTNFSGGKDTVTMQYSFDGKLLRTLACQAKGGTNAQRYRVLTKTDYDDMGRAVKTSKKVNGSPEVVLSESSYDELGQLKLKKLGRKRNAGSNSYTTDVVDSLRYTYNIRGWLRGINKDYARGENGAENWFGMELAYDYGFSTAQLNGNIAGTRWRAKGHDDQRAYGFAYDAANRLLKGDFTQKASSTWNTSAGVDYSMKMGDGSNATTAYDANGNILKMWQRGLKLTNSTTIDSLTYAYQPSSNRLARVTDGITTDNKLGDFKDGTNTGTDDYDYDDNGNLILDRNKNISSIVYNHLNLPQEVDVLGKGKVLYTYDAIGNKLQKQTVDSTGSTVKTTTTTYLGVAVYQNDTLQFIGTEEGRLRMNSQGSDTAYYDYFIKDHLGNVRTMLTDEQKKDVYEAGFETANQAFEGQLFLNYTNIVAKPECFDTVSDKVQVVGCAKGDESAENWVVGAGKVLKVMAGDHVEASVKGMFSRHANTVEPTTQTPIEDLMQAMFSSGIVNAVGEHGGFTTGSSSLLLGGIADFLGQQDNYFRGSAYLSWVLLDDEQFKLVSEGSGFAQMRDLKESEGEECNGTNLLQANDGDGIDIPRNGYLYIYVSNTSTDHPVYFDQLHIEHTRGPLVEETQYYPFGMRMESICSKAAGSLLNRYQYNGKELQNKEFSDGSGLEWLDYGARMYDAQIGRWHVVDAASDQMRRFSPYNFAFNNPLRFIDPDGMAPTDWVKNKDGGIYWDENATSQATTKTGETYLGKTVVEFKGSRAEKLGTKDGKEGYIDGEGAVTATVTVYGSEGADDVSTYTGYTMGSDPQKFGAIDEGLYNGNYDATGKSGSLKSHWAVEERGQVRMMDGKINPNAPNQIDANGEGYKDGIFIHSSNSNGYAGTINDGKSGISVGCLLIAPADWKAFNEKMDGVKDFKIQVTRTAYFGNPFMGIQLQSFQKKD